MWSCRLVTPETDPTILVGQWIELECRLQEGALEGSLSDLALEHQKPNGVFHLVAAFPLPQGSEGWRVRLMPLRAGRWDLSQWQWKGQGFEPLIIHVESHGYESDKPLGPRLPQMDFLRAGVIIPLILIVLGILAAGIYGHQTKKRIKERYLKRIHEHRSPLDQLMWELRQAPLKADSSWALIWEDSVRLFVARVLNQPQLYASPRAWQRFLKRAAPDESFDKLWQIRKDILNQPVDKLKAAWPEYVQLTWQWAWDWVTTRQKVFFEKNRERF